MLLLELIPKFNCKLFIGIWGLNSQKISSKTKLVKRKCENELISMSRVWDKEKIWVPDRIWTYDLQNTEQVLYPLELQKTHGVQGHKLY